MLQARNYRASYRLRAWSLLDMTVALRDLDPFGGEFGGFWRCLSYLDPFHVYLDPFMFT